jgi:RNA polymerase sigma-70 factor (ECF subfamily)
VDEVGPALQPVIIELGRHSDATPEAFVADAFDAHQASIFGLLLAGAGDSEVAADATQEAFLRLLAEARRGRFPDRPGAWLYRTGVNLVISNARRGAVARRFAPRLVSRDVGSSPEGAALEHERSTAMREVLQTLTPIERAALVMAAQGVTGQEIAVNLGKSHGATRTLLSRARMRLREGLAAREAGR